MTTEQLRKEIEVSTWHMDYAGISITYYRSYPEKTNPIPIDLKLDPEECARQLSAIDSIDSWEEFPDTDGILIHYNNRIYVWSEFYPVFKLSQWEAFTLAIRHEAEKELEKDSNLLEMDRAIEALKNS